MTFVAIQNNLTGPLAAIGTSLLTFVQILGGSVILSMGQTVFTASLRDTVPVYATGASAAQVIAVGATGLRETFTNPEVLAGVLLAYSKSIGRVYYLAIGCSGAAFLLSFGMGWKDIRQKEEAAIRETPEAKEAKEVKESAL